MGAPYREEVKDLFRQARDCARARGVLSPSHARGPHHYVDEELVELLHEVLAEPIDKAGVRHEEATVKEYQQGSGPKTFSIVCTCTYETGRYPAVTAAVGAHQLHIFERTGR